jgi:hypothetical protein
MKKLTPKTSAFPAVTQGSIPHEDYVVAQAGFLLLEVSKMMKAGRLDQDYEKFRKSARRAALRAAKVLDNMSPNVDAKQILKDLPMP